MPLWFALDTNVLLSLSHEDHAQHELVTEALRRLVRRRVQLCFAPQNLGEFWNVSTRPLDRNGFGLSTTQTDRHVTAIERRMTILHEDQRVYPIWRRILQTHAVKGVQVHDAHLAAVLEVHQVSHLMTFNGRDFKRFTDLIPVHPEDVSS